MGLVSMSNRTNMELKLNLFINFLFRFFVSMSNRTNMELKLFTNEIYH